MQFSLSDIARVSMRTRFLLNARVRSVVDRLRPKIPSRWNDIGILLSYRCPAACATCYLNSSPRRRGVLCLDDLRNALRELKKLGQTGRDLHFGGGEPFLDYEHLLDCFEIARQEGMLPIRKLETSCFWCVNDSITRQRLAEIKRFGVLEILISCDPFHQQYIPIENVRRALRIAIEVFGSNGVQVWQQHFLDKPVDIGNFPFNERSEAVREVLREFPVRFVGRAAGQLAQFVRRYPKEQFTKERCARSLLWSKTIHVDPHGNVYPGICAGIPIGNTKDKPLSHIYKHFEIDSLPMVKALVKKGPVFLLQEAINSGFKETGQGYASKCHVCYEARRFFWEHGLHRDAFGPEEVYVD